MILTKNSHKYVDETRGRKLYFFDSTRDIKVGTWEAVSGLYGNDGSYVRISGEKRLIPNKNLYWSVDELCDGIAAHVQDLEDEIDNLRNMQHGEEE